MQIKRSLLVNSAAFLTLLFVSSTATSQESGYIEVTAPEAKIIQEENNNALIINVLSPLEFEIQRIPKSINIPINTFETTTLLPKDKTIPILTYCMGVR